MSKKNNKGKEYTELMELKAEERNIERQARRFLAKQALGLAKWRCPWLNTSGYVIRE